MTKALLKVSSLATVVVALAAFNARAEGEKKETAGETKTKIENVKEANKVQDDVDADEVITNKKMRAEAGSKSKWSIGATLSYSGATVEAPLKPIRPNIAGGKGMSTVAALGGSVGIGYKMTSTDRLSLDTGVRWVTPLEAQTPKKFSGNRYDVSDPSISYTKLYKWSGIQSVLSLGPTLTTASDSRKWGYQYGFGIGQNNIYDVGTTGLSVGLYMGAGFNTFDKKNELVPVNGEMVPAIQYQSDYSIGLSPFVEYVINDTFNLRTVFNYASFEHARAEGNMWKLAKNRDTQSVGLGISVTRDIFLYPNIQFAPENITKIFRADETNVAITSNLNVF